MTDNSSKLDRRAFVTTSTAALAMSSQLLPSTSLASEQNTSAAKQQLSPEHIAAVNRERRVVVNFDTGAAFIPDVLNKVGKQNLVKGYFSMIDDPDVPIDSVWLCFGEGNCAFWPSDLIKVAPEYRKLHAAGLDPLRIFLEASKKRGLECFFSYRNNGSDNEYGGAQKIPLKEAHPEWLLHAPWEGASSNGFWNFSFKEVRELKVATLREVADNYDFDGIEIDFSRGPIHLPIGHQWENRRHLTAYLRAVRSMTLAAGKRRGRPFLLATRLPGKLAGCHYDGMDVETWVQEQLIDILILGNRSYEVDLAAFRRLTSGTAIKLYPCLDDHHASDGYEHPPIEVFRGVFSNWLHQSADGVQTFNFHLRTPEGTVALGKDKNPPVWKLHQQALCELADPAQLRYKDKTFVVQRRGGGHGAVVVPDPANWVTPRHMYYLTNMFSQLPAPLANDGRGDTLLWVYVADDVAKQARRIEQITVRVLLSDEEAKNLPDSQRLEPFSMSSHDQPGGKRPNVPPAQGIEEQIELRLNNILLPSPVVKAGWLEFTAQGDQFAVGKNLVGLRVDGRSAEAQSEISVELLEVHVKYS